MLTRLELLNYTNTNNFKLESKEKIIDNNILDYYKENRNCVSKISKDWS